jgi:tetratricopeptide (TPR) repeat protein
MTPERAFARRLLGLTLAAALLLPAPIATVAASRTGCSAATGQALIDQGRYTKAVQEFTCVIAADPTTADGYRGRAEAQLLLGRYADALTTYTRVTAVVLPVHPDAAATILDGYGARLTASPTDRVALTGASFVHWWLYEYPPTIKLIDQLLAAHPDDPYGLLFRGSSRLLKGLSVQRGIADLDQAVELAPTSADVRWVVADAYWYGQGDSARGSGEAAKALDWGLDTPRVHSILASTLIAMGDTAGALPHLKRSIDLVTLELVTAAPLAPGSSTAVAIVPGRTVEIPVAATTGQTLSIATSSKDYWDTIAVLIAPDGSPVAGSDDTNGYFAAFDWVATTTATYHLRVTFFESVNSGSLLVERG